MAQGGRVRTFAPATVIMLIALTAVTACTAEDLDAAPTVTPTPTTSGPPDREDQADAISPLVIGSVAPEPVPVLGSDERYHVAYELTVLNFSPRPAVITAVETLGPGGEVLTSLSEGEVGARTLIVADYSAAQTTAGGGVQIPSGKTALLVLDDVFAARGEVPASVTHRITASFGRAESGEGGIAVLWPDEATQIGGEVGISDAKPIVIAAPLQGDGWFVDNACCTLNAHRNVLLPVGGRINGAERFAIDVSRIDVTRAEQDGFSDAVLVDGDPTRNEDNLAYGAPVLAVADGTVVAVHATDPDTPAGTLPLGPGFTLANLGGNSVVLELAPDLYAVYYHLAPDSPAVEVGDTVTKGQEIARLGNSGNSSAAHLHFQLSRTPLVFSSDVVPYVIEEFTVVASLDPVSGRLQDADAGTRQDALPLALTVVDFP